MERAGAKQETALSRQLLNGYEASVLYIHTKHIFAIINNSHTIGF